MTTRTERINWLAMHLVGELQMVASKDAYPTTVQVLNTAVDGELAELQAERNELRAALQQIMDARSRTAVDVNNAIERARAILEQTEPATCQHPTANGLCGAPATHRGMTSGDALCAQCAARREQWDTEDVREVHSGSSK